MDEPLVARQHVLALDGLRAVAVLVVFAVHWRADAFPGGFLGVDLFFVLSGYLITALLLAEQAKTGKIWMRGFYTRRALRLAPALVFMVLVVTPLALIEDIGRPWLDATMTLLYLQDVYAPLDPGIGGIYAHTWSLAVEEQFYLVWPALLVLCARRLIPPALVVVAMSGLFTVAGAAVFAADGFGRVYRSPLPHVVELGVGALLALALQDPAWRSRLNWLTRPAVPMVGLGTLGLGVLLVEQSQGWLYVGGFVLVGLVCAAIVGGVVMNPRSLPGQVLASSPLVWLGRRSYAFYLWHYPVLFIADKHIDSGLWLGLVALAVTLSVTQLSWVLVEQPFLRRKERFQPSVERVELPEHQADQP